MGYESLIYNEILLTAGQEPFVELPLTEHVVRLDEIIVRSPNRKEAPVNPMVLAGGRTFSVEESGRFAGGFDDPARLVTSFAGVTGGVGDNPVIIHGNAPHLLLWRLEGMEIANPNHFADLTTMGGGLFSSLSSHVLGNSDFLTGAYPAEYNNAFSGVFDMTLRTGNDQVYKTSAEGSLIGLDVASEGPLRKGKKVLTCLITGRLLLFLSGGLFQIWRSTILAIRISLLNSVFRAGRRVISPSGAGTGRPEL